MTNHFRVVGVRTSSVASTDEGSFTDEAQAIERMGSLAGDTDCLLAEIVSYPRGDSVGRLDIIGQSERVDGEWLLVAGELRQRSFGGEAEQLLRDAKRDKD